MRYLFVHAHPDDETLSSGAIIVALVASGHQCLVVTATRGEMGQALPGSLPAGADLTTARQAERAQALAELGAIDAGWLGEAPNRAAGRPPRIYRDSAMVWLGPALAGPSPQATPDSLCHAQLDEVVADLVAAASSHRAEALVSYDAAGGYGHPDHIRCHEATRRAASLIGVACFEIVTDPARARHWYDLSQRPGRLRRAHQCYPTQFVLDGDRITHVGGQTALVCHGAGLSEVA